MYCTDHSRSQAAGETRTYTWSQLNSIQRSVLMMPWRSQTADTAVILSGGREATFALTSAHSREQWMNLKLRITVYNVNNDNLRKWERSKVGQGDITLNSCMQSYIMCSVDNVEYLNCALVSNCPMSMENIRSCHILFLPSLCWWRCPFPDAAKNRT